MPLVWQQFKFSLGNKGSVLCQDVFLGFFFWALVSCIVIGICFEVFCLFFLATGSPLFVLGALASVIILLRERSKQSETSLARA